MKAVILAAGTGKRLEPLTNVRPKPMIPVANKPILEHLIERIARAGIDEIVLVVGYKRERIQSYFGDGDDWDVQIQYAFQESQLGTGDAVLQAEELIDDDFLVMNGDRIFESRLLTQLREKRGESGQSILAVTYVNEPELYGVVETTSDNVITQITEKPPTNAIPTDLINAGVYAFGPEIFSLIEDTSTVGELALTDVLTQHADSKPVLAHYYDGTWLDVSRPWDLLTVNETLLDQISSPIAESASVDPSTVVDSRTRIGDDVRIHPNTTIQDGVTIGDNVHIGPNVTLQNTIILEDATIKAGSVIRDSVISANVSIGPNTTVPGGSGSVCLQDRVHEDIRMGAVIGDNVTVGGAVTIDTGTFIGNGSTISMGSLVAETIPPETLVIQG